ncbi:MAG: hypothetical protein U9R36_00075, partial [Elusimicrobiota bacterium]|nr:hypothetical protein [Elusimicrobiota bacterium]
IIGIHGNKDNPGFPEYVTDVHLKPQKFGGVVFGGCQGAWPYKPIGHFLYSEEEIKEILAFLPRVDVFLTHNPPKGETEIDDMVHNGFKSFNDYIKKHSPAYHLHGHVHKNKEFKIENTKVISVFGMKELEINRRDLAGKDKK